MSMRSGFQKRGGFGDGGGGFRDRGVGRVFSGGFDDRGGGFRRDISESGGERSPFRGGHGGGRGRRGRRGGFRGDSKNVEMHNSGSRFNRKRAAVADDNDGAIDEKETDMNGFAGDKQSKKSFNEKSGKNAEVDEDNDDEGDDMDEGMDSEAHIPSVIELENDTSEEKQPTGKAAFKSTPVAATQQSIKQLKAAAGSKVDKQQRNQQQPQKRPGRQKQQNEQHNQKHQKPADNKQQQKKPKDAAKTQSKDGTSEIDVLAAVFGPERAKAIRKEMDVRFRVQKRRQLFIGNLKADITANDIRVLLPEMSAVDMRRIAAVPKLKVEESFHAIVEFRTEEACQNAHSRITKIGKMGGRDLNIDFMGENSENAKKSAEKDARNRHVKFVEKAVLDPLKLYVSGVGAKTEKADLEKVFRKCVRIVVPVNAQKRGRMNRKANDGCTFCFVYYSNPVDAKRAFETTNGTQVGDSRLTVMFATAKKEQAQDVLDVATGKKAPKKARVEKKPDDADAQQSGSRKRKQQNDSATRKIDARTTSQQLTPNKKQKMDASSTAVAAAGASNKKQQQKGAQQTPDIKTELKFDAVTTPANTNKKQQQQKISDTSAVEALLELKEKLLSGGIDPSMLEAVDEYEDYDEDSQHLEKGILDRAAYGIRLGAGNDEDDGDDEDDDDEDYSLDSGEGEMSNLDGIFASSSKQQLLANTAEKRMCNFDDVWDALLDETKRIREEEYKAKNKSIGYKPLMVLLNDTTLVRAANDGDDEDAEPLIDEDTARRLHQIVWRAAKNAELSIIRRRRTRLLYLSNKDANSVKSMSFTERVKFMLTHEKAESARRRSSPANNGSGICRRSPQIREVIVSKRCSALTNDPDFRTLLNLARRYVPNVGKGAGEAVLLKVLQRKQTKIQVTPKIAQQLYSFLRREKIATQKSTSKATAQTVPSSRRQP